MQAAWISTSALSLSESALRQSRPSASTPSDRLRPRPMSIILVAVGAAALVIAVHRSGADSQAPALRVTGSATASEDPLSSAPPTTPSTEPAPCGPVGGVDLDGDGCREAVTVTGQVVSVCDERYVAAVALCFVQGWRVSEALGLAWQDLDLDAGTVRLRRGSTYADGIGMVLGAPKTSRTAGRQLLARTTLTLLAAHRDRWQRMRDEQAVPWPEVSYQGEMLDLVFVNAAGRSMLRQHVDKAIRRAAEAVGLDPSEIGTHTGRRSVVTNLYASGDLDLEDVAGFVGHSDVSTTRGYVQSEGERPQIVSRKAFGILDPGVDATG